MKKVIIIGLVVVIIALGGAVYYLLKNLNAIVERQIEKIGTQITGTRVSVASVDIDLKEGSGEINGLVIANPPGYKSDAAFRMDKIRLDIGLKSILKKDPIVIDEVLIDSPIAVGEFNEMAKLNVLEIKNNATSGKKKKSASSKTAEKKEKKPIRLRIKKLTIKGVTLSYDAEALGGKKGSETLPAIYKTNIGGTKGATPEAIGKEIIITLTSKVAQAVAEKQFDKYKKKLEKKATEEVNKLLDKALGND